MEEKNKVFRKKSLNKLASPETINDYIKVSNPSVWIALIAIAIILAGGIIWGIFGKIDTVISVSVVSEKGNTYVLLDHNQVYNVRKDQTIIIDNKVGTITSVNPDQYTSKDHLDNVDVKDFISMVDGPVVYLATCDIKLDDGVYFGKITIGSVNPISLLWE